MSASAHVQSIQALDDLKGALGCFRGEAQEALGAAEQEIRRTQDWLQERLNYWQNEVNRRQEEVRRAAAALARCQASGYTDREGRYHAPDCTAYEHTLQQAQRRLQEAEMELVNVRRWLAQVHQAAADYQVQARRLRELTTTQTEKAQAFLGQAVVDLERYLAVAPLSVSVIGTPPSIQSGASVSARQLEITWAERRAILERVDAGQTITPEELRRLQLPISDLQAGTLAQDEAWLHQMLESERYREAMRDSQEAEGLKDALLAALKAIDYWRSKP